MPHEEQGDPAAFRACHGRAALARVCPKHAWPRLWLGLESISWGDRARQHPHPSSAPRCPAWRLCRGYPQAVIPAQGNFSTVRAAEIFRAHRDIGEGVFSPCSAWHGGVREKYNRLKSQPGCGGAGAVGSIAFPGHGAAERGCSERKVAPGPFV